MSAAAFPSDERLPQAARMLDLGAVEPVLEQMLGRPPSRVKVGYLRYRPGSRLLVSYKVELEGEEHQAVAVADSRSDVRALALEPEHRALAERVSRNGTPREALGYSPELEALVQWSPLDVTLPALAESPEQLRRKIEAAGIAMESSADVPRLVKHKPFSRAVLRLNRHVVKVYGDEASFGRAVHAMRTVEDLPFPVPRCEATVPELRIAVQSVVAGARPGGLSEVAARAGALLATLHDSRIDGLPAQPARDRLAAAGEEAQLLAAVCPGLAPRLDSFIRTLEEHMPAEDGLVPSHGGFHLSQLLLQADGGLGVIDFDGACLAPAARDLGSYAVSEVERPEDVPEAAVALAALCEAYGSRPPGATWYLAAFLLRRARRPFTRWKQDWPEQVETRLAAAEEALKL